MIDSQGMKIAAAATQNWMTLFLVKVASGVATVFLGFFCMVCISAHVLSVAPCEAVASPGESQTHTVCQVRWLAATKNFHIFFSISKKFQTRFSVCSKYQTQSMTKRMRHTARSRSSVISRRHEP